VEKSRGFAEVVRKIAREQHLPLIDYAAEIMKRRPEDWDGALPAFEKFPGDEYQVPTLIAKDGAHPSNPKQFNGDYSEEALRNSEKQMRLLTDVLPALISYIDAVQQERGDDVVTVVLPELITRKWWHKLLHNQAGPLLRIMLATRRDVILTSVRYFLER